MGMRLWCWRQSLGGHTECLCRITATARACMCVNFVLAARDRSVAWVNTWRTLISTLQKVHTALTVNKTFPAVCVCARVCIIGVSARHPPLPLLPDVTALHHSLRALVTTSAHTDVRARTAASQQANYRCLFPYRRRGCCVQTLFFRCCYVKTWPSSNNGEYLSASLPRLTGSRHGMPRPVHTEPCSPGICGQQERLFPVTGKYNLHAPVFGQRATRRSLSDTTLSDVFHCPLPTKSDCGTLISAKQERVNG